MVGMAHRSKKQLRSRSYLYLLINTLVWGAFLIIVKPAFEYTTPFRFLMYRYILASVLSLPILIYFLPQFKKLKKSLAKITLIELLGGSIALSLLYSGLKLTSAIEASLITTTTPIFVSILAVLMLKEKEESHELVGLEIAFVGTLLLTLIPIFNGYGGLQQISLTGNLLVMAQNIATAFYWVLVKKHYQRLPKMFVALISFYVCLLSFIPLSVVEAGGVGQLLTTIQLDLQHTAVWVAGAYGAVFGSIIGFVTYLKGQEGVEASEATLFSYLQPAVYIPLGILILGESVSGWQITSLALILIGVAIAERRS